MDFSLDQVWGSMGLLARGVTLVLLLMAVVTLGVFLERLFVFYRHLLRSRHFAGASVTLLAQRRWNEAVLLGQAHLGSWLAELVVAGLQAFERTAQVTGTREDWLEPTRRVLLRRHAALVAQARRGLPVLASVGSVAPFVGLFGTVVGIINAFEGIARTGSGGLGAVSAGIAEALVVTALGLAVAIPAVLAFNFLTTRIDQLELALGQAAEELLDLLEQTTVPAGPDAAPGGNPAGSQG